jgi:hypothetical protein
LEGEAGAVEAGLEGAAVPFCGAPVKSGVRGRSSSNS